MWTAKLGDCRCVVGSEERKPIFATEDCKPQHHKEKARNWSSRRILKGLHLAQRCNLFRIASAPPFLTFDATPLSRFSWCNSANMAGCPRHAGMVFRLGTLASNELFSWADFSVSLVECLWPACFRECGAPRSVCLSAYGAEKESLRICLNDDLHSSSWLDARVLLADVGCLKEFDPSWYPLLCVVWNSLGCTLLPGWCELVLLISLMPMP